MENDKTYTDYVYRNLETFVPDWISVSPTLNVSNSVDLGGYSQDTNFNAVFQTSPGVYEYYGPENAEYDNLGYTRKEWSPELTDNASAVIDFSGLSNGVTNASDLYSRLFGLIGTSIGVPCGTCAKEYYGISFTGSELGLEIQDNVIKYSNGEMASGSYLNLSKWKAYPDEDMTVFDKVRDLMKTQAMDENLTDDEKKTQVEDLAREIATKLTDASFNAIENTIKREDHFDKVLKTNDGKIVIYDFRDTSALSNVDAADSAVQTSAKARAKVPVEMLLEGEWAELKNPLMIQSSSEPNDRIPIDLPCLDEENMGIQGYNVSYYREEVSYSEEYQRKLSDWENSGTSITKTITIPATPEHTITEKQPYLDFTRDGEQVTKWKEVQRVIPEVPERTITTTETVYNTPRPEPGPDDIIIKKFYEPDDVKRIADALDYVSTCRARMGVTQNRLEHAYDNNLNNAENTTAAESRIRDTDMAKEMVTFSNKNILEQMGQAMMAQANQSNQGVLGLLQ